MPVLLAEKVIQLEFSDLYGRRPIQRPAEPLARAPGIHQSGILQELAYVIGKLKPGELLEEDMPWRMAMGVMWEEFAFSVGSLQTSVWQPGELTVDEISVNCDGIGEAELSGEITTVVDETKCTEKKVRTGEDFLGEWMWMKQGAAYLYCYGAEVMRWTILYYRGDWQGSGPICMQYLVRFTHTEIVQNWRMLLANKHLVEKRLESEKGMRNK